MKILSWIFKWIITLAFSLSAGLLTIILLSDNPQINSFLLRILILSAVGFFSGFFMRILFLKGYQIIQVFFSLLTSVMVILVIDYYYETEYILVIITEGFRFQIPSTSESAQIAFLLLICLPVILLVRKKRTLKTAERQVSKPIRLSFSDRLKPIVYRANPKNWNIRLPDLHKDTKTKRVSTAGNKSSSSVHVSSAAPKGKPKNQPYKFSTQKGSKPTKIKVPGKRSQNKNNNDVKLMGEEEHVCPYCLEEVVKSDSRGVAVCPECSTWHHQDCWDITGGCGVAHRNQL